MTIQTNKHETQSMNQGKHMTRGQGKQMP